MKNRQENQYFCRLLIFAFLQVFKSTKLKGLLVIFGIVFFATTTVSAGSVYYVSQDDLNANDSNPGSETLPWLTLKEATNTVVAGDTVIVRAGEYVDSVATPTHPYPAFNPVSSGTVIAPITFRSEPMHAAKIKAREYPGGYLAWGLKSRNYIIIDGFFIIGGFRANGCNNITVKNVELIGGFYPPSDISLNWGIALEGVSNSLIKNNYVHDMLDSGNHLHNAACFMVFGNSDYNIIENNTADGNGRVIYSAFGQKGGSMDFNTWRFNFGKNVISGFLGMGSTDGSAPSTNNSFYQNIIIDSQNFIEEDHRSEDFEIYNNTAYNCDRFFYANLNDNLRNSLWNNIAVTSNRAIRWQGYPIAEQFSILIDYSDYNNFETNYWAMREKSETIYCDSLYSWQLLTGFDSNSSVKVANFINAGGDVVTDYKRTSYSQEGRGGSYASVIGAYITGNEIIGYIDLTAIIPSISTITLPNITQNNNYSQTIQTIGGTTPYTYSITAGSLPTGLSLNASSGVISGTPTVAGVSNFTIQVTDSDSPVQTDTQVLSINVLPDTTSPSEITNLSVAFCTSNLCSLTWTAPGNDNTTGTATTYDIRYSIATITDDNWSSTTQVTGESSPQIAGTLETHMIAGLTAGTTYYFAIKTSDEVPNESGLGNVVSDSTTESGGIICEASQGYNCWYVATDGSDSNDGSFDSPFGTVQKGIDTIQPGDYLYMRGGTYAEYLEMPLDKQGSESQWYTMKSYPGEWAIINPGHAQECSVFVFGGSQSCAVTHGSSGIRHPEYWHFTQFEVTGGGIDTSSAFGSGFRFDTARHIKFTYLYIHDNLASGSNNQAGISLPNDTFGPSRYITIKYNHFNENCGSDNQNCANIDLFGDYVSNVSDVVINNTLQHNEIAYNLIEGSARGIKNKNKQYLSLDHTGTHMDYKDFGDKIHHNIIRGFSELGIFWHQDFAQIHNNIIDASQAKYKYGILLGENTGRREPFFVTVYNNLIQNGSLNLGSWTFDYYGVPNHPQFYFYNNIIEDYGVEKNGHNDLNLLFQWNWDGYSESDIDFSTIYAENNLFYPRQSTDEIINVGEYTNDYSAEGYISKGWASIIYTSTNSDLHLYGEPYKTDGSFILEDSTTIANGGIGGAHPYLEGVQMPSYVGAVNPNDNDWVAGVLSLADINLLMNGGSADPSWIEGSTVSSSPSVYTLTLHNTMVDTNYSQTIQTTGGTTPYTYSITVGSLPIGLILNASSGIISGTPTVAGVSNFTIQVADSDSPVQTDTQELSITVEVVDTTASVLTEASPTGEQPAGTTQTTISLTTNETATCRYSTTADTAYASMPSEFSTTGETSHSQNITGLSDGNSYSYFVRCVDTATNVNLSDYEISFSIASDITPPTRSNPSPAGEQTAGTTNTTISLTTNETAICRYSTNPNIAYNSMTNTFTNTNSIIHSTTVLGLLNGNTYNYYIKCEDTETTPNQNTDDFPISFSIANTTYGILDFIELVIDWLKNGAGLTTDINNDGVVNSRDLGIMMSNWGS